MNYKKNYIGKGVQHESLDLVKVTLKFNDLLKFKHTFEGQDYLTFELARLQEVDNYGRTHTAYVSTKEVPEQVDQTKKKKSRTSSKK